MASSSDSLRSNLLCVGLLLLVLVLVLPACERHEPQEKPPPAKPTALWIDYPQAELPSQSAQMFSDDGKRADLTQALEYQLAYYDNLSDEQLEQKLTVGQRAYSKRHLYQHLATLNAFLQQQPSAQALDQWLRQHTDIYKYNGPSKDGKFAATAYYVPELRAAKKRTQRFRYPLYAKPRDLVAIRLTDFSAQLSQVPSVHGGDIFGRVLNSRLVPYFTREQIDYEAALKGRASTIGWLANDIERFFLHVQGSGQVRWPDGSTAVVGYAASNGHPYVSLGKLLKKDGTIPDGRMSMQAIKSYFTKNPAQWRRYSAQLPRYIFFSAQKHATAKLGTPVVSKRTIAVDPKTLPLGLLAYVQMQQPHFTKKKRGPSSWKPLNILVLSQDIGGGIKGNHIDVFWGFGDKAGRGAGHIKQRANVMLLLPKTSSTDVQ